MFSDYLQAALRTAKYEILPEDGSFYAEIPQCNGVFANAETLEACREQLAEVMEDWVLVRVHRLLPLPEIAGIELSYPPLRRQLR
ncbi:MAG: type II toxin-antitoxin system HicB family antitoxin [Thermoanaerobaculia bacterium]|nr:type II toxin-antitoxin system HicB family antitoxin [Thermoanaerobaculia bacterium]